ncbi:membrane dipeptidase [Sphingobium sp. HBC34]|uniref:Membrane dipeptidase n=1 Tax=Sphingobium cyanobacteriorum TaxID=3063954 RepID=A0ABT8ZNI0_9SPHN|nr:membrane dipeptidase [Sphingobium sp. HBC34]MDO7835747.1 membrane dipeptidase [Sphingobium sp. HBC34]
MDGLSFLPDDLADIGVAGLDGMICDVSEIEEIRDAQGVPRYLRTYIKCSAALDAATARLAGSSDAYVARKGSDIGTRPGCATFLQFQSCEPIGTDLSRIADFHRRGLRVLQFTHHNQTLFAGGALDPKWTGLTPLGIEGLAEMNRVGIMPDVSHGSEPTMLEAARRSSTPILLSHGACKAIVNHPRCASDTVIRAIADKGGMMGIFMMSFWLTRDPVPTVDHLIAHIRHVVNIAGIDAVGISNDFPMAGQPNLVKLDNDNREGVKEYIAWWLAMRGQGISGFDWTPEHVVIPQLNRIDRMATIAAALDRAGFRSSAVERIMGGNWRRVLTDTLG